MVVKENSVELLKTFTESEKVIRVFDALKVGIANDNLVIIDTFLQNLLNHESGSGLPIQVRQPL